MTDKEILSKVLDCRNHVKSRYKLTIEEKEYLNNRYYDSDSEKETIIRMLLNIEEKPKCKICGKPVSYISSNKFRETCSNKECIKAYKRIKTEQTCINKYGCKCVTQSKEFKEKSQLTKLEKYGDKFWSNPQKTSQTNLNRTDEQKLQTHIKTVNTCLERYGVVNGGGSKEAIDKIRKSMIEKYGVDSIFKCKEEREKWKEICKNKYGEEYYQSTKEFKDRIKEKWLHGSEDKRKKTKLLKYGSETFNNQEKRQNTIKERYGSEHYYNNDKRNETMKLNNSYGKSKEENKLYELLKDKYPDIIRQYTSKLYPFNCDFYIPSKDLYIEYQGSQYHHKKPFEGTEDDLKELEILKLKAKNSPRHKLNKKSQYDNIIYVWTDLDVRKRNTAKENNLNFIELWNINDYINV